MAYRCKKCGSLERFKIIKVSSEDLGVFEKDGEFIKTGTTQHYGIYNGWKEKGKTIPFIKCDSCGATVKHCSYKSINNIANWED